MAPRAFLDYRVHSLEIISRGPVLTRTSKAFTCHCLNSIHRTHRTRLIPISRVIGNLKIHFSGKRGGLNRSTQHSSRTRLTLKTKVKSLTRVDQREHYPGEVLTEDSQTDCFSRRSLVESKY